MDALSRPAIRMLVSTTRRTKGLYAVRYRFAKADFTLASMSVTSAAVKRLCRVSRPANWSRLVYSQNKWLTRSSQST